MVLFRGLARGSYFLAFIEALERFSYYGMRGLLVLFATAPAASGGLGWTADQALPFYGYYTACVWMAPLLGGWVADRWLGSKLCVLLGGWAMFGGLALLASGSWLLWIDASGAADPALGRPLVFGGLAIVAGGIGLLKGNITVMLSDLYSPRDPRRDEAFSLYYVAINFGVVLSALIAGSLGEWLGWTFGFGACAIVLFGGVLVFSWRSRELVTVGTRTETAVAPVPSRDANRRAMRFVLTLLGFATIFFAAYEQTGGFVNLMIYEHADRTVGGFTIPATWFIASTGVFCILIGPAFTSWLATLRERGAAFDTVGRFALGLGFAGLAYAVFAVGLSGSSDRFAIAWAIAFYLLLTLAELALAPAGFAMATRYAPPGAAGRLMGLWLLSIAAGSVLGGQIGAVAVHASASVFAAVLACALVATAFALVALRARLNRWVADL